MPNDSNTVGKKYSDVARPGHTPASATSRPILVSVAAPHIDPTLKKQSQISFQEQPKPERTKPRIIALDNIPSESNSGSSEQEVTHMQSKSITEPVSGASDFGSTLPIATQPLKTQKKLKKKRSRAQKTVIGLLLILILAVLIYNAMLLSEYIRLK